VALPYLPLALGTVLVFQQLLPDSVPPAFLRLTVALARGRPSGIGPAELLLGLVPWALFLALQLGLARLLRVHGQLGLGDGRVAAMVLVPGYNVLGTAQLFSLEGAAMARLGAGPGTLPAELRVGGLAAAIMGAAVVGLSILEVAVWRGSGWASPLLLGTLASILGLGTLVVRLLLLVRLHAAIRPIAALPTPAEPLLVPVHEVWPAWAVASSVALCLLVPGLVRLAQPPPPGPDWPDAPAELAPGPSPAQARPESPASQDAAAPAVESAPSASAASTGPPKEATSPAPARIPAAPCITEDWLAGGRPISWWTRRLELLRARSDPDGRALYQLTTERALANDLSILEEGAGVRAAPSEALLRACQEARP
jgi:hypothetical protein